MTSVITASTSCGPMSTTATPPPQMSGLSPGPCQPPGMSPGGPCHSGLSLNRPPSTSLLQDDDFCSSDEVKIFKDEDEGDEEKELASNEELQAALLEDKSSLILETEMGIKQECLSRLEPGKCSPCSPFSNGYPLMSAFQYHHHPGDGPPPPPPHTIRSTGSSSPVSPFLYNDPLGSPPPAHMGGIPYNLDPSLRHHPLYHSMGPYPYSLLSSPDVSQFSPCGPLSRFGPGGLLSSPGGSAYSTASSPSLLGPHPTDCIGPRGMGGPQGGRSLRGLDREHGGLGLGHVGRTGKMSSKPHIKKPLNAFMLYMKEMRPKIVAECTLKESAAINQILGRRWHSLNREEQAKYYEMARKERQLHMQMYPGWSARDNYAQSKKRKRKRNKGEGEQSSSLKKCRARYGLEQQDLWCKPCNRDDLYVGMVLSSPSSSSSSSHMHLTSLTGNDHDPTSGLLSLDCIAMTQPHPHHPSHNLHPNASQSHHINNGHHSQQLMHHTPNFSIHEIETIDGVGDIGDAGDVIASHDNNHHGEGVRHSPKYISL